jgi:hypothetical protein
VSDKIRFVAARGNCSAAKNLSAILGISLKNAIKGATTDFFFSDRLGNLCFQYANVFRGAVGSERGGVSTCRRSRWIHRRPPVN